MTEHSAATGAGRMTLSYDLEDELAASRDQLRAKDAEIERLTKALTGLESAIMSGNFTPAALAAMARRSALKEQDQ